MEFAISISLIAKMFVFAGLSGVVALLTLSPINDQKISKGQFIVFGIVEAVLFAAMFGFISFRAVV